MAIFNTIFTIALLSAFLCLFVSAQSGTGTIVAPTNGTSTSYSVPKPTSSGTKTTGATGTASGPATTSSTGAAAGNEATGIITALVGAIVAAMVAAF
ncbi:MAG: hypothetical protein M1840_005629 [Geoglossum simile]|nr:MAG: hypothetical protein M1840_005629 [Geoglossum simile]